MTIKGLSLQGGGVLGAAQVGMIYQAFEEGSEFSHESYPADIWPNIAGTSIGALNGLLMALRFSSREIYDLWFKTKKEDLIKRRWNIFKSFYSRKPMKKYIQKIIYDKTGREKITFKELYDLYGVNFICTGTLVHNGKYLIFGKDFIDHDVLESVMISTAYPLAFSPPIFIDQDTKREYQVIDGAMLVNTPLLCLIDYLKCDDITILAMGSLEEEFMMKGLLTSLSRLLKFVTIGNQSMSLAWARRYFKGKLTIYYAPCKNISPFDWNMIHVLLLHGIQAWKDGPIDPKLLENEYHLTDKEIIKRFKIKHD